MPAKPRTARQPQDHKPKKTVSQRQDDELNETLASWLYDKEAEPVTFDFGGHTWTVETMAEWSLDTVYAFEHHELATFARELYGSMSAEWGILRRWKLRELDDWFAALRDTVGGLEPGESGSSAS